MRPSLRWTHICTYKTAVRCRQHTHTRTHTLILTELLYSEWHSHVFWDIWFCVTCQCPSLLLALPQNLPRAALSCTALRLVPPSDTGSLCSHQLFYAPMLHFCETLVSIGHTQKHSGLVAEHKQGCYRSHRLLCFVSVRINRGQWLQFTLKGLCLKYIELERIKSIV